MAPAILRDLAPVAKRVMAMTGTATECERGWKDWSNVVSLRRSTLHHDRATKLVKLYHHTHKRHTYKHRKTQAVVSADTISGEESDTPTSTHPQQVPHEPVEDPGSCTEGWSDVENDLRRTVLAGDRDADESDS